ncbi:MAG: adenylate/guanylate cyclase domain-containing protein [Deltaproteobacteria bacterium]|nr:adenylate/guanylate cyclase domain-containing protein [Deltaproteobacteria bacterium]
MEKRTDILAILFADIAKSTRLYETLGDETAQQVIGRVLARLGDVVAQYRGRVVKTIGDEVMCTFPRAHDAVEAAKAMQEAMDRISFEGLADIPPPNIYVGLAYGPVISEAGDVYGDAVIMAARMVELAKPRQILTTDSTVAALPPEGRSGATYIDTTTIKGKTGEVRIHEIIWERMDKTVMVDGIMDSQSFRLRLELRLGKKTLDLDVNRAMITFGRQSHNDFVVDDSRVSRSHAKIEYRRGRFVLIDQSSNGTWVLPVGGKISRLKKEEYPLTGYGVISLGHEPDRDAPDAIHYMIKT